MPFFDDLPLHDAIVLTTSTEQDGIIVRETYISDIRGMTSSHDELWSLLDTWVPEHLDVGHIISSSNHVVVIGRLITSRYSGMWSIYRVYMWTISQMRPDTLHRPPQRWGPCIPFLIPQCISSSGVQLTLIQVPEEQFIASTSWVQVVAIIREVQMSYVGCMFSGIHIWHTLMVDFLASYQGSCRRIWCYHATLVLEIVSPTRTSNQRSNP